MRCNVPSEDYWKFQNKLRELVLFLRYQRGLNKDEDYAFAAKGGEIHVICRIDCYPAVKESLERYGLSIEGVQTFC